MKLIINNHPKNSDKLTKISGRDLTTKFTIEIKSRIVKYIKSLKIVQY